MFFAPFALNLPCGSVIAYQVRVKPDFAQHLVHLSRSLSRIIFCFGRVCLCPWCLEDLIEFDSFCCSLVPRHPGDFGFYCFLFCVLNRNVVSEVYLLNREDFSGLWWCSVIHSTCSVLSHRRTHLRRVSHPFWLWRASRGFSHRKASFGLELGRVTLSRLQDLTRNDQEF